MNKTAIKNYAIWARVQLIESAKQRAFEYEITENGENKTNVESIDGRLLSKAEIEQRNQLIREINSKGFSQVMEEVAYTWFNRFIALRFMEVNGYLPSKIRVFTNEDNEFKPEILKEAMTVELDNLDRNKVLDLLDKQDNETLYKYLLITQCNALYSALPAMFEKIENWTELLFPANLLREGSVIEQMISLIPEDDWKDAVQIIGWLYQFYNSEKKDDVFAALKKNVKITKENIPAATQLFTPDWIVRYMVENSLGRLWVEGHPNNELKSNWKYYLEEAEQEPDVQKQLAEIRKEYALLKPEDIKCIDPCMGSGHILVYIFDVLMQIYGAYGYTEREAVASIVENNIYGLDIDERASQLAYFSVMMKACQYDKRFLRRGIQPKVYAVQESNNIDRYAVEYFCNSDQKLTKAMNTLLDELHDAKEYGSILNVSMVDFEALKARIEEVKNGISFYTETVTNEIVPFIHCAEAMAQKYHIVVTNPPYMGGSGMSAKLSEFVKKNWPDSKSDLFAVFIEKCGKMVSTNGFTAMITQHAWMFLSSYEKLRGKLLLNDTVNMVHLGARAFDEIGGEVVQTTSFAMRKTHISDYKGMYCRLIEPTTQDGKEDMFLSGENRYNTSQDNFTKIPGSPVAYWVGEQLIKSFECGNTLKEYVEAVKGLDTCDNDRFVRVWSEVNFNDVGLFVKYTTDTYNHSWYPYCKGGGYSKWYGFMDKVVLWENDGEILRNIRDDKGKIKSRPQNIRYYFRRGLTWSTITSYKLSLRLMNNCIFGGGGSAMFSEEHELYFLGFINSCVTEYCLNMLNPTLNFLVGDILALPVVLNLDRKFEVEKKVQDCVESSIKDWDSFETSWDFKKHPLI